MKTHHFRRTLFVAQCNARCRQSGIPVQQCDVNCDKEEPTNISPPYLFISAGHYKTSPQGNWLTEIVFSFKNWAANSHIWCESLSVLWHNHCSVWLWQIKARKYCICSTVWDQAKYFHLFYSVQSVAFSKNHGHIHNLCQRCLVWNPLEASVSGSSAEKQL